MEHAAQRARAYLQESDWEFSLLLSLLGHAYAHTGLRSTVYGQPVDWPHVPCRKFQRQWALGIPVVVRNIHRGFDWRPECMMRATRDVRAVKAKGAGEILNPVTISAHCIWHLPLFDQLSSAQPIWHHPRSFCSHATFPGAPVLCQFAEAEGMTHHTCFMLQTAFHRSPFYTLFHNVGFDLPTIAQWYGDLR